MSNPLWYLALGWLVLANIAGFALMGIDKSKAVRHGLRVRESTFFRLAAAGGAFGIVAASGAFHHKSLKGSFMGVVYFAVLVWLLILLELQNLLGPLTPLH